MIKKVNTSEDTSEVMSKKETQSGVRVNAESKAIIQDYAKEIGVTEAEALDKLLSLSVTKLSVKQLSGMEIDIDSFESHLNGLREAYSHLISVLSNTEERASKKFQAQLESDKAKLAVLAETQATLKEKEVELTTITAELAETKQALLTQHELLESLKSRLPDCEALEAIIKSSEKELHELREENTKLKASCLEYETEIKAVKAEADLAKRQAAADLKAAVADAKLKERDRLQARIDELLAKIDELRA